MASFINATPPAGFCARPSALPSRHRQTCSNTAPRMTANWPDDPGADYSKFLSRIPMDRLNKAPMITINYYKNVYKNNNYDSVSVRLADMGADEGAGDSLKAGVFVDPDAETAPDVSKWGKYYDPATVNEAPYINLHGPPLSFDKYALSVVQTSVPCNIPKARGLLNDVEPDPLAYMPSYQGRLNMAPFVKAVYGTGDEDSCVSVDTVFTPLNVVGASELLSKYRS